jgi:hypothetical protein
MGMGRGPAMMVSPPLSTNEIGLNSACDATGKICHACNGRERAVKVEPRRPDEAGLWEMPVYNAARGQVIEQRAHQPKHAILAVIERILKI